MPENIDVQQLISLVKELSWPGAAVVISIVAYKAGILGAITEFIKSLIQSKQERAGAIDSGDSGLFADILKRMAGLEQFKSEAEGNHYHDLEELKVDRRDVWARINALDKAFQDFRVDMSGRISRLEGKIFNGNSK